MFHSREHTSSMKIAKILDEEGGTFRLEYDNDRGNKQNTRLDALTYEQALREAKGYLEIGEDARDPEGTQWEIE
jgi:hypothetical protein